jgi:ketosteroid isomerase-like protein
MIDAKTLDPRMARIVETLASGDGEQMKALCHPELVVEDPASLPFGGAYHGYDGLLEVAGKLFASIEGCRIEPQAAFGELGGDEFILRQRMTGRSVRTGRPVEMEILELYRFQDGLLIGVKPFYWDTAALRQQL